MKAQTKKAIAAEISKLKRMKPYVQRFSIFGDDNHEKIEAQIESCGKISTKTISTSGGAKKRRTSAGLPRA